MDSPILSRTTLLCPQILIFNDKLTSDFFSKHPSPPSIQHLLREFIEHLCQLRHWYIHAIFRPFLNEVKICLSQNNILDCFLKTGLYPPSIRFQKSPHLRWGGSQMFLVLAVSLDISGHPDTPPR